MADQPLDTSTRLAVERTRLANERTLMAWIRTLQPLFCMAVRAISRTSLASSDTMLTWFVCHHQCEAQSLSCLRSPRRARVAMQSRR
jgi:hypothetical protein